MGIGQVVEIDQLFPFELLGKPTAHYTTPCTHKAKDMVAMTAYFESPI
jgi:hypothetical protein